MSGAPAGPDFHFIVKHEGKYYLTHELWEFDPETRVPLQSEQQTSLTRVKALYTGSTTKAEGAVHVKHVEVSHFTQIGGGK